MLRNIIFDMGNVLILYDPVYFVERIGIEEKTDRTLLLNEIFRSSKWPLLDRGALSEQELEEFAFSRLPERLHEAAHKLIFHWNNPIVPIPGMPEFLQECKAAGLNLYLLSNASFRQPDYWRDVPGNEFFDGTMVSAFEGCMKPSKEIFRRLLNRFHLKAEECFFVDDIAENVEGAKQAGIDGFIFKGSTEELRVALSQKAPGLWGDSLC